MEIITYATESRGRFDSLINNKFSVPVTVLGWGQKWTGFTDKFRGVLKHLENKKPDDIVIFLDGFDSEIIKDPKDVIDIFKSLHCAILFSNNAPLFSRNVDLIERRVFGTCKNDVTANTGMYMGYTKNIKELLSDALRLHCNDDQRNINTLCEKYDDIKVDEDEKIFKNITITNANRNKNTDAFFISFPGGISVSRYTRALTEYYQFFYYHISVILIVLMTVFPISGFILLITHLLWFVYKSDKSCI